MITHGIKDISSLVTACSMKGVVNSIKNPVLTIAKEKDLDGSNDAFDPCPKN